LDASPTHHDQAEKALAWDQFYDYCFDVIRRCPSVKRLSEADREDCAQEVMMEIVRKFGDASPAEIKDSHTGWIRALSRNKATDIVRRRYRKPETTFDDGTGSLLPDRADSTDLSELAPKESISLVWEALLGLDQKVPVTSYLVFYLRNIENWDVPEIADLFNLSHDQVRSRCHRVRKMFEDQLRRKS
jgi:RNA polymerase sigma factor (sigma-70 family)